MASQVEVDPQETREWLEALDAVVGKRRSAARAVPARARRRPRPAHRRGARAGGHDAVPEHDPAAGRAASSGRRGARAASTVSIVRWNAIATILNANKTSLRARRPHRLLPVAPPSSTRRASTTSGTRRRDRHGGDLVYMQGHSQPGRLRPRVPRGPHPRGADAQVPHGGRRRRAPVLPAPVADAGLLAVPHGLDGPRPADGDLPGPLHEVPAGPRPGRDRRPQGLGLPGRRRDRRARVAGRDLDGRPRAARQPDLRHQLQPAAPRRPGARQRQDHPGARDELPRRGLERHQGHLGLALGPAARRRPRGPPARADERGARRRLPDLQVAQRRLRARALLRRQAGAAGDGRRHERRARSGRSTAAAWTSARSTRPTRRRSSTTASRR